MANDTSYVSLCEFYRIIEKWGKIASCSETDGTGLENITANGALINYVVTLINPAQHDYNNNERFKETRERKSIIKISLSHSRHRPTLRPLITDVLLTRISEATMATIFCFLRLAIVIPLSREGYRGKEGRSQPGLAHERVSRIFVRTLCTQNGSGLFRMVRLTRE